MTVATASYEAIEITLPNSGKVLTISSDLLSLVHMVESRQGFVPASDSPPYQAKASVVEKLRVLREVNLRLATKQEQLQLFWFGLYCYWLPPKELDVLAVPLLATGFVTRMEYNRLARERVTLINFPQSRR